MPGTGITIERLRQLILQLRFVATDVWAPMLDRALVLGHEPVDRHEYAAALHAAGIARRPWYPEAVNALAELCGRAQRVSAYPDLDARGVVAAAQRVFNRHVGVAALADVAAAVAEDQHRPVSPKEVAAALTAEGGRFAADGTWVWRAGAGHRTPGLLRAAQGMLAVAGRLPVPVLHNGCRRRLRGRRAR